MLSLSMHRWLSLSSPWGAPMITGMDVSVLAGKSTGEGRKNGVRFAYNKVSQRLYGDKLFFSELAGSPGSWIGRGGYHYLVWAAIRWNSGVSAPAERTIRGRAPPWLTLKNAAESGRRGRPPDALLESGAYAWRAAGIYTRRILADLRP
jgi:hypothetical protein